MFFFLNDNERTGCTHLEYVGLEERDEQYRDGDQLTDVLEPVRRTQNGTRGRNKTDRERERVRKQFSFVKCYINVFYEKRRLHEEQYGHARVGQVPVDERVEQQVDGEQRQLDDQHQRVPEAGQSHFPLAAAARVRRGLTSLLFWHAEYLWQRARRRAVRSVP